MEKEELRSGWQEKGPTSSVRRGTRSTMIQNVPERSCACGYLRTGLAYGYGTFENVRECSLRSLYKEIVNFGPSQTISIVNQFTMTVCISPPSPLRSQKAPTLLDNLLDDLDLIKAALVGNIQ
ncbi:hypothetical protein Aduo_007447 [Ancylostoma duodenale]